MRSGGLGLPGLVLFSLRLQLSGMLSGFRFHSCLRLLRSVALSLQLLDFRLLLRALGGFRVCFGFRFGCRCSCFFLRDLFVVRPLDGGGARIGCVLDGIARGLNHALPVTFARKKIFGGCERTLRPANASEAYCAAFTAFAISMALRASSSSSGVFDLDLG